MQKFTSLSAIIFSICLVYGCSGNNADKANNANEKETHDASSSAESFSVNVDDTAISGHGTGAMQLNNAAFIYPPIKKNENTKRLYFILVSDSKESSLYYSCTFDIPYKAGDFIKNAGDGQQYDITLDTQGGDFSRYIAKAVTVNISSLTATRVAGTFSGTFDLSGDTPHGTKKSVTLSNGKFDIPFSTGSLRPI